MRALPAVLLTWHSMAPSFCAGLGGDGVRAGAGGGGTGALQEGHGGRPCAPLRVAGGRSHSTACHSAVQQRLTARRSAAEARGPGRPKNIAPCPVAPPPPTHTLSHTLPLLGPAACAAQAWGVLEARQGNFEAARQLFQQGVWSAPPRDRDVSLIFQVGPAHTSGTSSNIGASSTSVYGVREVASRSCSRWGLHN